MYEYALADTVDVHHHIMYALKVCICTFSICKDTNVPASTWPQKTTLTCIVTLCVHHLYEYVHVNQYVNTYIPASTWPQKTILMCFLSVLLSTGAASAAAAAAASFFCLHPTFPLG